MGQMIKELAHSDEGILGAERILKDINWQEEEETARALSRELGEMDYWSGLHAAREDGLAEGITKGREEGEERARREKFEHARKMKADGFTVEQIERYSGLLRGEIEGL